MTNHTPEMTLNPEQEAALRVRVAELRGLWKFKPNLGHTEIWEGSIVRMRWPGGASAGYILDALDAAGVPDLDLNATHEAERVLDAVPIEDYFERGWGRYHHHLIYVTGNTYIDGQLITRATALQRAIAFYRTLSKEPIL